MFNLFKKKSPHSPMDKEQGATNAKVASSSLAEGSDVGLASQALAQGVARGVAASLEKSISTIDSSNGTYITSSKFAPAWTIGSSSTDYIYMGEDNFTTEYHCPDELFIKLCKSRTKDKDKCDFCDLKFQCYTDK